MPKKKHRHHKKHFHLTAIIIFIFAVLVSIAAFYIFERQTHLKTPSFDDYKVSESVSDKTGANFAGHFILTLQSCGQNCQTGSVIDALNGRVYDLPVKSACGAQFRRDSKLLIINSGCAEKPRYFVFEK